MEFTQCFRKTHFGCEQKIQTVDKTFTYNWYTNHIYKGYLEVVEYFDNSRVFQVSQNLL